MKLCPKCQKQFSDDANFCPVDAARLLPLDDKPAAAPATDSLATRFELGAKLGGNRTGIVFRATDKQTKQAVAVKVVSPQVLAIPGVAQRLDRELKQLERVASSSVAKLVASGRRASPVGEEVWVAMELVEGAQTLAQAITARGPIAASQAADLVEVIGEALIEAAQVGVVHRDLAPKNVLFAGQDIKLINFPLPVPYPGTDAANKPAGVPEFVAPEQVDGKPVDQRSNLYNLGALYYYVLTGTTVASGSADDCHRAHAAGQIKPPSQLVATIPASVEAIILRALDKSPTKRFLTVRQFVDEVGRVGAGNEVKSTMPLGKANKQRAEIVQTLLGVNLSAPAASTAAPAPVSAPIATAPTVGGVPALAPMVAAAPQPAAPQPAAVSPVSGTVIGLASGNGDPAPAAASIWAPPPNVGGPSNRKASPAMGAPVAVAAATAASPAAAVAVAASPAAAVAPAAVTTAVTTAVPAAPLVPAAPIVPPQPGPVVPQPVVSPPVVASPVVATPATGASAAGKKKGAESADSKGKFRETLWFKKGELDAAAAQVAAAEAAKGKDVADAADHLPIDERYKDDGTISRSDKEKYSLRTGGTQMIKAVRDAGASSPGHSKVSEDELIGEMKGGRNAIVIAIVAALVLLAILVFVFTR
jgi:hypothetical protein